MLLFGISSVPLTKSILAINPVRRVKTLDWYFLRNSSTSSGDSNTMSPLLIAFLLNVSENDPAKTSLIPAYNRAVAACSLEEPDPKLKPATSMSFYN